MARNETVLVKPRRRRLLVPILISAAVVGFCVFAIAMIPTFRGMIGARKVFKAYHQALIAKDYTAAYSYLAPETKANVSYDKFVAAENKLSERVGALKSLSTSGIETHGDEDDLVTTIRAMLKFEKGSLEFEYVLREERGAWFIYKFDEL